MIQKVTQSLQLLRVFEQRDQLGNVPNVPILDSSQASHLTVIL